MAATLKISYKEYAGQSHPERLNGFIRPTQGLRCADGLVEYVSSVSHNDIAGFVVSPSDSVSEPGSWELIAFKFN